MKYLICNLKANKTFDEILLYKDELRKLSPKNTELIIAPTSIYLPVFKNEKTSLCSQDISLHQELNLTGDISLNQLKSLNVKYTIIAHAERRKYYEESEIDIITKIKAALNNGLKVIYCIGETPEELARCVEYQVLERSLARIFNNINKEDFQNIIIAYEPIYLIGTEQKYNIKRIKEIISFIKKLIFDYYENKVTVVFGGSINPQNIKELTSIKELDGFIIGSAAQNPSNISDIIKIIDN